MANPRKKVIESLRKQIAKLEAMEQRELEIKETVQKLFKEFKAQLKQSGVTLEEVVRAHYREINRAMDKIKATDDSVSPAKNGRKKSVKKKKSKKKKASSIKIPAGTYTNIPPDTKAEFKVNPRGPRPKVLKAHAEKLGLEKFLAECKK